MEFNAYQCDCGYNMITPSIDPKCPDCGKLMVPMDTTSNRYKKFDQEVKDILFR